MRSVDGKWIMFKERLSVVRELLGHFWELKLWWMIPLVLLLLLVAGLLVFAQGSAITPFLYPLF